MVETSNKVGTGTGTGSGSGAAEYSAKSFFVGLLILCVLGGGGWFGYVQIFTKGVERLPARVCDDAVDRGTVTRALPSARTAEEEAGRKGEGESLRFSCRIATSSDSLLSGHARIDDASVRTWQNRNGVGAGGDAVHVSSGGVEALAQRDSDSGWSSVYVACVPRGADAGDASQSFALIAEGSVVGDSGATGAELRQAVTDFSYQLAAHAYALAGCEEARPLPERLPRYGDR
ncbi:hypothetical protein AB0O01_20840 [Streptomyces sp. NPDC093252]|uniref:hypothetical protein n=1 Tax=Streptomyces sp. NPDC093252 TaxID=3154980 RepID=UPI0034450402